MGQSLVGRRTLSSLFNFWARWTLPQKMHLSLLFTLLSVFTVANCFPGGGSGHGGVFNDPAAQEDTAAHYGEGFIESLGSALKGFRSPHHEGKRQLQRGQQFLPADAQGDFSTHIPGGSYYTHKAHHRPIVQGKRYKRSQDYHELPAGAYEEHRLPKGIVGRAPGPNAFADPNNGFERFQNIHNTAERQQVYFS